MKKTSRIKILFKLRALFGILSLFFFCSSATWSIITGIICLVLLCLIDEYKTYYYSNIKTIEGKNNIN
jgi:hypothetical protein